MAKLFKKYINPTLFDDNDINIDFGRITRVEEYRNTCYVRLDDVYNNIEVYYKHPHIGDEYIYETKTVGVSQIASAWGIFSAPTEGSYCLILRTNFRNYLLATFPALNRPEGTLDKWRTDRKINIDRLPILTNNKRSDPGTTTDDETILKKGELFLRSSGLADILLDYFGRILVDSGKQFTIRIGDRDTTTNIMDTIESQLDIGRVVSSDGNLSVDGEGKLIKFQYELVGKNTKITINEDGKVVINVNNNANINIKSDGQIDISNTNTALTIKSDGNIELGTTALEKIIKGESFKTFFNTHIHPTPTGPSSVPTIPMTDSLLSTKNKVGL